MEAPVTSTSHKGIHRQQQNPTVDHKSTTQNLKFQNKLIKMDDFKFIQNTEYD